MSPDNLKYYPTKIRNFTDKLESHMKGNMVMALDAANDNTQENEMGLAWLRQTANRIESSMDFFKSAAKSRHKEYPRAIYELMEYMGSFRGMAKLLNETAKVLGFKQDHTDKSLRDTYRHYLRLPDATRAIRFEIRPPEE